ncbi:hypothetical protein [Teredinibacter turnerae]|uniref:hypothetical protein n=1 Tax=Teredinibacter turnerae TaxID=2426 RepID=UPI00037CE412|nr:hypothetical protein [Teredinibacter turnerae]
MNIRELQIDNIRTFELDERDNQYSLVVFFPIHLDDDSGVAHVLEHMISKNIAQNGYTFADLNIYYQDISVNAETDSYYVAFYFTCNCEASFSAGLETIISSALVDELSYDLFNQECFHFDNKIPGGVVYNEMKNVFCKLQRRLDFAFCKSIELDSGAKHEPGGLPFEICNLSFSKVLTYRNRYINKNNCNIIFSGLEASKVVDSVLNKYSKYYLKSEHHFVPHFSPAATSQRYIPEESEEQRVYVTYAIALGKAYQYETEILVWFLRDMLKELGTYIFDMFALKNAVYHCEFTGVKVFGGKAYLCIVSSGERIDGSTMGTLLAGLVHIYSQNIAHTRLLKKCKIQYLENIFSPALIVPNRLLFCLPFILNDDVASLQRLAEDIIDSEKEYHLLDSMLKMLTLNLESKSLIMAVSEPATYSIKELLNREVDYLVRLEKRRNRDCPKSQPNTRHTTDLENRKGSHKSSKYSGGFSLTNQLHKSFGVDYYHCVYNLNNIPPCYIVRIPIVIKAIKKLLGEYVQYDTEVYLFSHITSEDVPLHLMAIKIKILSSERINKHDLDTKVHAVLDLITSAQYHMDDMGETGTLLQDIKDDSLSLAFHSCQSSIGLAINEWRGIEQFYFLQKNYQPNEIFSDRQFLDSLRSLKMISFLVKDNISYSDTISEVKQSLARNSSWMESYSHIRSWCKSQDRLRAFITYNGAESNLVIKSRIPTKDRLLLTCLFILSEYINEQYFNAIERDLFGAYGARLFIDFATFEVCIMLHRVPDIFRSYNKICENQHIICLEHIEESAFERYRNISHNKLLGESTPLNNTIRLIYNELTGTTGKLDSISREIESVTKEFAVKVCRSYFKNCQLSVAITTNDTLKTKTQFAFENVYAI